MSARDTTRQSEARIRDRIRDSLRQQYTRQGEDWGHIGGRFYRLARVFFFLFSIYAFILDGAHVLALVLSIDYNSAKRVSGMTTDLDTLENYTRAMGTFRQHLWLMIPLTLALALTAVLVVRRRHLAALILGSATSLLSLLEYGSLMSNDRFYVGKPENALIFTLLYALTLLIPLNLLWMQLIAWRDNARLRRETQRLTEKLYARHRQDGVLSSEKWEALLAEEAARPAGAPPPARRHRRAYETDDSEE